LSIETLESFENATVYVYSESGILLAERVYEMDRVLLKAGYSIENLSAK
jgi:hypothetical protein